MYPNVYSTASDQFAKNQWLASTISRGFLHRVQLASERFSNRIKNAYSHSAQELTQPLTPWDLWRNWFQYSIDTFQRSVLFWDTMRKRGNNFIGHLRAGEPPLLHFDYKLLLDARKFKRAVNYALLEIIPPKGVTVDPKRRPYVIIDPRAGHGPGVGGFKDDSEVGVALRAGHPVYFVMFYPDPEPDQTPLDVCAAEQVFIRKIRELHPDSSKPIVVGNCQGGWAAMMLAASDPELTGPIVINGAPMSYWAGAWREGEGDNPIRYNGGLVGGSWLGSLLCDLGNGIYDGANLVMNFENLNPANTFWKKYHHLFANIDTERDRFLDFERWWGGFYLLNKKELEWMVQNIFVGNKLWSGKIKALGHPFDLRAIRSPIILFASLGDNITPPQQAFNWVADIYGSTEEIKARGQVIVGLMHQDVGHLGIFVSGQVARKEHAQILSVLKSIEVLPPGLYGMRIHEHRDKDGTIGYKVQLLEQRLEDVAERLNRMKRVDEKPFEVAATISELNQHLYDLFGSPLVRQFSNEYVARLARALHPLRVAQWAISDFNPWLAWLGPWANLVKANRRPTKTDKPFRQAEQVGSEFISAWLDYYRDIRDAVSEATFFQLYAPLALARVPDRSILEPEYSSEPRDLPEVRAALEDITEGGYSAALERVGCLLAIEGSPVPLERLELKHTLKKKYKEFFPDLTAFQWRQIRGKQEIICRYEPKRALSTLPQLLANPKDRLRLLSLWDVLFKDPAVVREASPAQIAMLKRIRALLTEKTAAAAA